MRSPPLDEPVNLAQQRNPLPGNYSNGATHHSSVGEVGKSPLEDMLSHLILDP